MLHYLAGLQSVSMGKDSASRACWNTCYRPRPLPTDLSTGRNSRLSTLRAARTPLHRNSPGVSVPIAVPAAVSSNLRYLKSSRRPATALDCVDFRYRTLR